MTISLVLVCLIFFFSSSAPLDVTLVWQLPSSRPTHPSSPHCSQDDGDDDDDDDDGDDDDGDGDDDDDVDGDEGDGDHGVAVI